MSRQKDGSMKEEIIKAKFEEIKKYIGETDAESRAKIDEFHRWLNENDSPEMQEYLSAFMEEGLSRLEEEVADLRKQIGTEYDLLPLSYIAKHYFGKSKAWLFQRINGYRVRGKVYTLNDEQKAILNEAVQDIAKKIGSVHIA